MFLRIRKFGLDKIANLTNVFWIFSFRFVGKILEVRFGISFAILGQ